MNNELLISLHNADIAVMRSMKEAIEKLEHDRDDLRKRLDIVLVSLTKERELSNMLYLLLADDPETKEIADKVIIQIGRG